MPQDKHGTDLEIGDVVQIDFVVRGFNTQEHALLESVEPMFPSNATMTLSSIAVKHVVKKSPLSNV